MCRPKEAGGRRCSKHLYVNMSAESKDAYNARRRIRYQENVQAQREETESQSLWHQYGFAPPHVTRRGSDEKLEQYLSHGEQWRSTLSEDQSEDIISYGVVTFEGINALHTDRYEPLLEKRRVTDKEKQRQRDTKDFDSIQGALSQAIPFKEPHILYRTLVIKDGSASDYARENFQVGQDVSSPSFLSTSFDSDLTLRYAARRGASHIFNFEILTDKGAVLKDPYDNTRNIQSEEREVLLPAHMDFTVVGVHDKVNYESSRDFKIAMSLPKGAKTRITVVQLVEKSLLKD